MSKQLKWECAANHLPDWTEELDIYLSAVISKKDHQSIMGMLTRYNDLTNTEDTEGADGHAIYGIEKEKEDLINDIVKIYEKYRQEAIELRNQLKIK